MVDRSMEPRTNDYKHIYSKTLTEKHDYNLDTARLIYKSKTSIYKATSSSLQPRSIIIFLDKANDCTLYMKIWHVPDRYLAERDTWYLQRKTFFIYSSQNKGSKTYCISDQSRL